jgi:L-cysteine/cystine lyase
MDVDLDAVRAALPCLGRAVYLNTGTAGPLPAPAARAVAEALTAELERGRIGAEAWRAAGAVREEARAAVAALLGADPGRIALLHHSTDGLNAAALGLRWRPGDVVVTTDLEHAAAQLVVGALRVRHGVEVRIARLAGAGGDAAGAVRALEEQLRGPVRAVVLSHVSYATGWVLPVRALAERAHAAGACVVVDGAQGAGALPVRPGDLGVDFYTVSGQKWLCGPEGTGALWVAPGWEERLLPGVLGYMGVERVDAEGYYLPHPGARRLEVGTVFHPGLAGWTAALRWLGEVGWDAVWTRTRALAARARQALARIPGVEVLTPAEHAGLVSFRLRGFRAEEAVEALAARGYLLRSIPGWDALRASCGFFLLEAEIDGLAEAVEALVRR